MLNWFRSLFKRNKNKAIDTACFEYKGFTIYPASVAENGQFRVAGSICKIIDGEQQTYTFIRSDLLPSLHQADELMYEKSVRFIDQTGDGMFDSAQ